MLRALCVASNYATRENDMLESLLTSLGLLGFLLALWLGILWPFFLLYGFFSALGSLRRIADALEAKNKNYSPEPFGVPDRDEDAHLDEPRSVLNSAFGR